MKALSFPKRIELAYRYFTRIRSTMKFPYKSLEEIREYQFKRIKELLIEAFEHVPFYRKLYTKCNVDVYSINSLEDFARKIPCITKKDITDHVDEFISDKFRKDALTLSRSSGTSGTVVDLYADENVYIDVEIQVIRMIKEIYDNYSPFDKEVLVYTSEYPVSSIMGFYRSYYINNLKSYHEIFKFILEKKPTVLAIYPSILREMLNRVDYNYKELGIKLIITNSEASSQQERDEFAEAFACDVIDEFSSEEIQSIAYQCKEHHYHEVSDCSYIEILDPITSIPVPNGQMGEIVGTSLLNYAMPVIRYRQGDYIVKSEQQKCPCGKNTPIFASLDGRKNSSFKKQNGEIIPSGKLLDWSYSLILSKNYDITEFQIVQETLTRVNVCFVARDISIDERKNIAENFRTLFGHEFEVSVLPVESIAKTRAGKHVPIRSKVF